MHQTKYDEFEPYFFGRKMIKLHDMDTDSFVLSVNLNDFNKAM